MTYERRSRRLGEATAPIESTSAADKRHSTGLAAWKRRHEAARRVAPLDCGCSGWRCRCTQPPLSDNMIDAGRSAALHILETTGSVPLLELDVLQALWQRGGADRELAQLLHDLTDGQVA